MATLNKILISAHSGWRWVVLILLLVAIAQAFGGWRKKNDYSEGNRKINLFAMIAFHLQWTVGLVLYFTSAKRQFVEGWMSNEMFRFYGLEHILMMTIAFVLITIGHSKSKKQLDQVKKHKTIFVFYTIALLLILAAIPWPFRTGLAAGWF